MVIDIILDGVWGYTYGEVLHKDYVMQSHFDEEQEQYLKDVMNAYIAFDNKMIIKALCNYMDNYVKDRTKSSKRYLNKMKTMIRKVDWLVDRNKAYNFKEYDELFGHLFEGKKVI